MQLQKKFMLVAVGFALFFNGCTQEVDEYNKPAGYWYSKIVDALSNGNIGKADTYYSSLQGEHIGSPLLPEATMILAIAHMNYEEYMLTEYFLDEYINRYASENEKEFAEFLNIKTKYLALPNPRRDQVLISDAIKASKKFKMNYPNSMYLSVVDAMQTNLHMADAALNEAIASLYDRVDKPKSAQFYRDIKPEAWIVWDELNRADTAWYKEWFEGDGTSSWYDFMIPDTQSVVSRNSVANDNKEGE